ncbi:MAG: M3 family metallopeptidase [Candidatus Hodarchaeales archaeon]|jgi:oligoendopeptidase F
MVETKEIAWDLTLIFKNNEEIQQTIEKAKQESEMIEKDYRGKIDSVNTSDNDLLRLFKRIESLKEKSEGIFFYGRLKVSADQTDEEALEFLNTVKNFFLEIKKKIAFVEIELGKLLEGNDELLQSPILENYRHYMEKICRKHKHILSEGEEQLILEKDLSGVMAWSQFRAEWLGKKPFKALIDKTEKTFFWSEAQGLMRSSDRTNRKNTIIAVMDALKEDEGVFSASLRSICANHVAIAKRRNYDTMASSLITNDITQEVIDNLYAAIEENLDIFHEILLLKAKVLGTEKLLGEDLWAPIPQQQGNESIQVPWNEAKEFVSGILIDFDDKFGKIADKMFKENHIDASPRKGKRGGAFCSTNDYAKECFILQSYNNTFDDLSTLAHEMGHALHGYLSLEAQTPINRDISYCIAECASEFVRFLLIDKKKEVVDDSQKSTILYNHLEDLAISVFEVGSRTQFEKSLYSAIEAGEYLNTEKISKLFLKSRTDYFGDSIDFLPQQKYDWMWKPHYFITDFRFYNYPYVFAELIVLALYNKFKKEGESFKPKFKSFLADGSSKSPQELVKDMDMDLSTKEFWQMGLDEMRDILREVKSLF